MVSSSGSWPSGCPEKYPWIGGEERPRPWYEMEMGDEVEVTSRLRASNEENIPPLSEIQVLPEDPRIQQLEDISMELTTRLYAAEAIAQRNGEELTRVNAENAELVERVASLSTYACKVWSELVAARAREDSKKWMCLAMTIIAIAAIVKK